jgi:hypothetical protein
MLGAELQSSNAQSSSYVSFGVTGAGLIREDNFMCVPEETGTMFENRAICVVGNRRTEPASAAPSAAETWLFMLNLPSVYRRSLRRNTVVDWMVSVAPEVEGQ